MRLGYSVTSKLVGFGVIAMVLWTLVGIPIFGDTIDSFFDKCMMAIGGLGLLSILAGVYFQGKEERLNQAPCKQCPYYGKDE